jgi:hypothetical protein
VDAAQLIGLAASVSLLSGWRLYLCVCVTGLAMHFGWIPLPEHLKGLAVLANWWIIGIAALGALAEFLADKVMWIDSVWDAIHTLVRPVGGALLALAIVDARDPVWQVAIVLLGGGAALLTHGAKAGTRALVNMSPESVSNIAVSSGEDLATGGALAAAIASPVAAVVVAVIAAGSAMLVLWWLNTLVRGRKTSASAAVDNPSG